MKKLKFFSLALVALLFCACEETPHVTPLNPVIAHLVSVEISQLPYEGYYYTFDVFNSATGITSSRISWQETAYTYNDLPVVLNVTGGQRLDKERLAVSVCFRVSKEAAPTVLIDAEAIPSLDDLKALGNPEEVPFGKYVADFAAKLHIRYD